MIIAIDGPAASGKSTIGRMLAEALGYLFLDTGFMYRAVTLAALQDGVDLAEETAVAQLARRLQIDVAVVGEVADGRHYTALLNGKDVTWALRTPEVDANVSLVSSYLSVREDLVRRQREFGRRGNIVMVGRDIGTVVLPNAPLKLYIIASAEERARRRWLDRQNQGHGNDYDSILADVVRRDQFDGSREHSPMRPAADAVIIDTTGRPVEEIVAEILGRTSNQ
ncbi:MAG: (d)CMP kinase [Ardenticatenaceae bacterium]|nr:(d)CMP kinase [Anaerolineales bacterium]MCB8920370.1 (d)CMP kinase [Ardenticatenaceae bacterium]MCB8989325.1 (d)CMP kinase [Ardenticatenaceae bacterium]